MKLITILACIFLISAFSSTNSGGKGLNYSVVIPVNKNLKVDTKYDSIILKYDSILNRKVSKINSISDSIKIQQKIIKNDEERTSVSHF